MINPPNNNTQFVIATENNQMVKQSNFLINARYGMTLLERRIYLKMVSMVKPDDEDFKDIVIDAAVLIEELGLQKSSAYVEFRNATKKLLHCICEINENKRLIQVALISSATYIKGQGLIILHFDPAIKPYLLNIKNQFTLFDLEEAFSIKSNHSLRVYELLKQYSYTGFRVMSLEDLRFSLNISEEQYPSYYDFKKRIILQAQKDLEKTPMAFKFKEIKSGKRVTNIEFTFTPIPVLVKKEKMPKKELITELNPSKIDIPYVEVVRVAPINRVRAYDTLMSLNISDYQARKVLEYANDKEIFKVAYDLKILIADPKIKNKEAYAYGALKNKFGIE